MKTVHFDIDTQFDFTLPSGALHAWGAERILERVGALNRHAAATGSVVVSTMDAHGENDPEFRTWPGHCIAGTLGQRKPEGTLIAGRVVIPSVEAAFSGTISSGQVLLEKQHLDCFTNPNLPAVLAALNADRYVVYGVVTEYCVKFAALGLLATGKPVDIVEDAICSLDDGQAAETVREFRERGGGVVRSSSVLSI